MTSARARSTPLRACLSPDYGLPRNPATVYGVLSLIVWSLILIVTVKYVVVIMRLDNRGEGGIFALLALLLQWQRRGLLIALGLFGSALLYGDGIITRAISVLSAVEGVEIAVPQLKHLVVPATSLILLLLFAGQRYGTARVGGVFGPIMHAWFATIGVLGVTEIARAPAILLALNPWHGAQIFVHHRTAGFLILGAVVLAVTGAEALYADIGHFGLRPIRLAWFAVVPPALLLNFLTEVQHLKPPRVPGTAVFLTTHIEGAPLVLQRHFRHNKALQEEVILLAIMTVEVPEVEASERITIEALPLGLHRVRASYRFMERPDVEEILAECRAAGIRAEEDDTTYYLGRLRLLPTGPAPMRRWRKRLFGFMARNASAAADFFSPPPDRVVELGARVEF